MESVPFVFLFIKQVFTNEDGTTDTLYLVTNDTTLSGESISAIYQKRWNVELYHKSLKQNVSLEKSPTQTVTTPANHFFTALCGYIKLELVKLLSNSTILHLNPNSICMQSNLITPRFGNSIPYLCCIR